MPSAKILEQKQAVINDLAGIFKKNGVYLIDYRGLTVKEMRELRIKIREFDGDIKVIKNRLAIKYFEKEKQEIGRDVFRGPTAVIYSDDTFVEVAKALVDFQKDTKKITIKKGFIENRMVEQADIIAVSQLPGRDQLMAQLLLSIAMPLKKFALALNAPLTNTLILMKNLNDKKEKEA